MLLMGCLPTDKVGQAAHFFIGLRLENRIVTNFSAVILLPNSGFQVYNPYGIPILPIMPDTQANGGSGLHAGQTHAVFPVYRNTLTRVLTS